MNRIDKKFSELRERKGSALIAFVTCGDPDPESTIDTANALIEGGADILELGLPFSDPIADGPIIQKSGERALKAGMNPDIYLEIAGRIDGVPKICLTYYNLVFHRGLEKFARDCKSSGIDGIIIPDLPIEEAEPMLKVCEKFDIDLIMLVAPTTTDERLDRILKVAKGFIYIVSLLGVTGVREELSVQIKPVIQRIRKKSREIPLAVGFGISKPEHAVKVIKAGADGAIVGSAFEKIIEDNLGNKEEMLRKLKNFARELKGEMG